MKLKPALILMACVAVLGFGTENGLAQSARTSSNSRDSRGGWDPAQIRERIASHLRQQLEITDDAEWKVIGDKINKVMDARMEVGFGGMRFSSARSQSDEASQGRDSSSSSRRGFFGGEPSPEAAALQKAIDSKASPDEIKARLAKVRAEIKAKEAKLEKAQDELRKLLTVRQEAAAVLNGLLK